MSAMTMEAFPESEWEAEGELNQYASFEHEGEYEDQEFWSSLAGLARKAAQNPALRRIGLTAARRAIDAIPNLGASIGGPGSGWSRAGQDAGIALRRSLALRLPSRESEWESEGEYEVNPIAKVYPNAVMEHLGRAAAGARDEAQAESYIGALVPLALSQARGSAPALVGAAPQLVQGAANIARVLRGSPSTQPLVRTMPSILQSTALSLARQANSGAPPTAQLAVRTLANQAARTLSDPRRCLRAYQRSQALDRRYHQAQHR
jgi:hypothetical protein